MNRNILTGIFVLWASCVSTAYANVVINEIAWMGTTVSGTNEWIELYNQDGAAHDLAGWKIDADDGSPSIVLSGTIAANGYFLIERTDDSTLPGISADLVATFGNGLSNGGETLRLKDKNGVDVNVVIGGLNWANVGGDNTTKDTAQRSGSGWMTGVPTPRAQNSATVGEVAGASIVTEVAAPAETSPAGGGSTSGTGVKSVYPRKNIVVEAGEDKRAFTAFPVAFSGSSTGLYNEPLTRATYRWNFGDGAISDERVVSHAYEFPGEYVVTLEVFLAEYHSADRLSVSVTNPDIIISKVVSGEKGYIELTNRTLSEMDLSGWSLSGVSGAPFVFSPNTIILSKKTFLLSYRVSGIDSTAAQLALRYPDGTAAFTWGAESKLAVAATSLPVRIVEQVSPRVALAGITKKTSVGRSATPPLGIAIAPDAQGATSTAAAILWQGGAAQQNSLMGIFSENIMNWVLGSIVLALLVIAGFIMVGNQGAPMRPADEYIIIEGNEEHN